MMGGVNSARAIRGLHHDDPVREGRDQSVSREKFFGSNPHSTRRFGKNGPRLRNVIHQPTVLGGIHPLQASGEDSYRNPVMQECRVMGHRINAGGSPGDHVGMIQPRPGDDTRGVRQSRCGRCSAAHHSQARC